MSSNLIYKVFYNGDEIGELSEAWREMWHINGKWNPFHTGLSIAFEEKLKAFDFYLLKSNPESAVPVILQNVSKPTIKLYCLATLFNGQDLGLRQLTAKEPLDQFFPKR